MRTNRAALAGALALFVVAIGQEARALQPATAPAQTPQAQPDVTACQACHGANGISSNPRTPNLAGQQPDYLVAQLQAFREGTRRHDLMQAIASQLTDEQMTALARYWSTRSMTGGDVHAGTGTTAASPAIPSRMTFPASFPTGFTLYQTVTEGEVTTERYANAAAIGAVRAGRPLPDGAMIVAVNREANGTIKNYAGMEARAGWGAAIPALLRNGNWDYAVFDAQKARNERVNQAPCLACHKPQADNSFVFTMPQIREAASRPAG